MLLCTCPSVGPEQAAAPTCQPRDGDLPPRGRDVRGVLRVDSVCRYSALHGYIDTLQVIIMVTFYVLVVATVARLLTQVLTLLGKIYLEDEIDGIITAPARW